jgi:osmotically inducible protein OsmC
MKRSGSAVWQGDLKNGKGTVSTDSAVLSEQQYSFGTRFENGKGTNPEELIAAAHAGCFTMALSAQLGNAGLTPEKLETKATVSLDKLEAGWAVTHILLEVKGRVPNADQATWEKATHAAKTGCPISKLLNTAIDMNAKLEK